MILYGKFDKLQRGQIKGFILKKWRGKYTPRPQVEGCYILHLTPPPASYAYVLTVIAPMSHVTSKLTMSFIDYIKFLVHTRKLSLFSDSLKDITRAVFCKFSVVLL